MKMGNAHRGRERVRGLIIVLYKEDSKVKDLFYFDILESVLFIKIYINICMLFIKIIIKNFIEL